MIETLIHEGLLRRVGHELIADGPKLAERIEAMIIENEGLREELEQVRLVLETWQDSNHSRRENPPSYAEMERP